MTEVTPIKGKSPRDDFDDIYRDLGMAIGDAKSVANLLSAVDTDNCDANDAGFALERILERAEDILSTIWKYKPAN